MSKKIEKDYYTWIAGFTTSWLSEYGNYGKLMDYLYSRDFYSIVDFDSNRAADGKDLRLKFVESTNTYNYRDAYLYLSGDCSVLEMMAALALKCEEQIMRDFTIGDRSKIWFYTMISSLGLSEMTDENFDEKYVSEVIDRLLSREYESNGRGGLFTVDDPPEDMRSVDIWYQLNYYLRSIDY